MKGETTINNQTNAPRIVSSINITLEWKRDLRFEWNGKAIGVILEFTEFGGFQTFWFDESNKEIEEPSWAPFSIELYRLAIEWECSQGPFNSRSNWCPQADKSGQTCEAEKF